MKKIGLLLLIALTNSSIMHAQLSAPKVEGVFGGTVKSIFAYSKTADTTRLFVSTESANSIFYTDIYNPAGTGFNFSKFNALPAANSSKGFGQNVTCIAAHSASGRIYFGHNSGLFQVSTDLSTASQLLSFGVWDMVIKDSILLFLDMNNLNYAKLDASGGIVPGSSGTIPIGSGPMASMSLKVHPINNQVYVFFGGTSPKILKTSAQFFNLSSSTTTTTISIPMSANTQVNGFGISPSGRLFVGGNAQNPPQNKLVKFSDNETSWIEPLVGIGGMGGDIFSFAGTATSYYTYFSNLYSSNKGANWATLGNISQETHPNNGPNFVDPNDSNTVYLVTDLAIAYSNTRGANTFEMANGLEAVQVRDFDMTTDKNTAWIASKAGIRKVTNYQTSPVWSLPMFPNGDGSPYYSVDIHPSNPSTVYAGNLRIYKSTNSGSTWNMVFSAELPPVSFPGVGTTANAIEICPFNQNIIFAGFEIADTSKGGLFYTMDAGNSWNQLLLEKTTPGHDVDVSDIVFSIEGSDTIAYVSVKYDLAKPQGRSVYRIVKSGATWTASQNMNSANTSTGSLIVASLEDLELSSTMDTVYATGTDAGNNHPVAYYKPVSVSNKWTPMKTTGFPFIAGKNGKAITVGRDTVYCAVDNEIYVYPLADSVWYFGYAYPVGTEINFLYFDDLLAGTGTGLYGHTYIPSRCRPAILNQFSANICQGDSLVFGNQIFKLPGIYNDTLKSFVGCDSIIRSLNLQVNPRFNFNNNQTMCFGGTFTFPDGTKSATSTTHASLLKSKNGCDSIVTITLTVNRPDVSMVKNPGSLSSNEVDAVYQWLDCGNNFAPIPGANAKVFTPAQPGSYAVKVTKYNCIDTSVCELVSPVGIGLIGNPDLGFICYPNPANDLIHFKNLNSKSIAWSIIDLSGKTLLESITEANSSSQADIAHLPPGMYFVKTDSANYFKLLINR